MSEFISIVSRTQHTINADVSPGCHIQAACEEAIQLALQYSKKVVFEFNEIEVVASGDCSIDGLVQWYQDEVERRAKAWQESDEGRLAAQETLRRQQDAQIAVDALLLELPQIIWHEAALVSWVGQFAQVNDHVGLTFDKQALADALVMAGYVADAEVGQKREVFLADKSKLARYLIGQAISYLRADMPLHPRLADVASRYVSSQK